MCIRDRYQRRVHGDKKYVAFGRVVQGFRIFKVMEKMVDESQMLKEKCKIVNSGVYEFGRPKTTIPAKEGFEKKDKKKKNCLLYTSPSPRDLSTSRMPSSA
eukprot:TRINITY_DN31078_c0_g1_i1.p3 TRINITY_DN31078_c0_g1~~TRINITY_DN31078_c0_g1_i1.p3  ORF type:complete len:101 (-),score=32.21 TRINITY_DN31078_c0_g1_i1:107-409(-)